MTDYAYILAKKYPNSLWELSGNDYENLIWKSNDPKPTQKELDDLAPIVKAEELKKEEARDRKRQEVLDRLGITFEELKTILS